MTGRDTQQLGRADRAGISWFLYTCGVQVDAGFDWYPITPGADPLDAEADYRVPLAGCAPGEITDDQRASMMLGRRADGWALYVGGLRPRQVPEGVHRPIRAVLLGLCAADADPAPLVDVAGLSLLDRLADELPVDWPDKRPLITNAPWPPAAPQRPTAKDTDRAINLGQSLGFPDTERRDVWADLARISSEDLADFPAGRLLVLRTQVMGPQRLRTLRPWRAASNRLGKRTEWPDDKEYKRFRRGHSPAPGGVRAVAELGGTGEADRWPRLGDDPVEAGSGTHRGDGAQRGRGVRARGRRDGRVRRREMGRAAFCTLAFVGGTVLASAVWLAIYYFAVRGYRFR